MSVATYKELHRSVNLTDLSITTGRMVSLLGWQTLC